MLSLILFRHGKSDWDAAYESDHERPLAGRGRDAARCMGKVLAKIDQVPDLAISSSAQRARDTLRLAAKAGRWDCPTRIDSALYETEPTALLHWLQGLDIQPGRLLLTGHESTWSGFAGRLIGDASLRVPTACLLRVDFAADGWQQVRFGAGELRWLMPPKIVCDLLAAD
jgi:phosphohistidine phosphatase